MSQFVMLRPKALYLLQLSSLELNRYLKHGYLSREDTEVGVRKNNFPEEL